MVGIEIPAAQRDNLLWLDTNQVAAITLEKAKRLRRSSPGQLTGN
jgi:hypothetical protein